jgi:glyoxylase-like metal-dependent hydrolase (beta-lactamase superfamily II)
MNYKIFISALLFLFVFPSEIITSQELIKVKNDIYMYQGKGGNIGLDFGEDSILMIDDQYEEGIENVIKTIKQKSNQPIKFLVNTHHHGDHTGGNIAITNEGATIFSHDNVRKHLEEKINNSSDSINEGLLPTITFSDDLTFYFNKEKILIFHVHQAHTDGDAIVYFTNSNVIHTGDTFFNGKYPYIDLNSGGSIQGVIDTMNKVLMIANDETKIIPGHGNLATKKELEFSKEMISYLLKEVSKYHQQNKTLEEILAIKEMTKKYDDLGYGDGFITSEFMIKTIYNDISKEK